MIYQFSDSEIINFILVLIRCSSFIVVAPLFGLQNVPVPLKILFSLMTSLILFPTLEKSQLNQVILNEALYLYVLKEVFLGLSIGFICKSFFLAISTAGQLISISVGLSASQLFNPTIEDQGTVIEQFYSTLAFLMFLALDGHHFLILGLAKSFEILPLNFDSIHLEGVKMILGLGQEILTIGLKMSAPVVVSIFITNLSMGIIGRAVPQINVLVTSLQLTLIVGFFVMIVALPIMVNDMGIIQGEMMEIFMNFIKNL